MIILVRFFFWSCKAAVLLLVWATFSAIGPLHDPVTWYEITYTGEQVAQWDLQNNALF